MEWNTHPIAYVLQSAAGARAVIGIWSIVLAEMCSEVVGSKRITFPWAFPVQNQHCTKFAVTRPLESEHEPHDEG
jgi:hypothetical protein